MWYGTPNFQIFPVQGLLLINMWQIVAVRMVIKQGVHDSITIMLGFSTQTPVKWHAHIHTQMTPQKIFVYMQCFCSVYAIYFLLFKLFCTSECL